MQSNFWNELQKTQPAEDHPLIKPQSTAQIVHSRNQQSVEPPSDSPIDQSDSEDQQFREKNVPMWDKSIQKSPLHGKWRNRRAGYGLRKQAVNEQEEEEDTDSNKETVLIHGLSVQRYREIYNSVLSPAALSSLSTHDPAEYMTEVLELKQRLWAALYRPQFQETVGEDGRVHITETFDLT